MNGKNNPRKIRAAKEVLARMTEDSNIWENQWALAWALDMFCEEVGWGKIEKNAFLFRAQIEYELTGRVVMPWDVTDDQGRAIW